VNTVTINEDEEKTQKIHEEEEEEEEIFVNAEVHADYKLGMSHLNSTDADELKAAYTYLTKAAGHGHPKAAEEVAIAHLFGDHLPRNLTKSRILFEQLSRENGFSRSQFYTSFMYATGLGCNSSQSLSLTYSTFGALGDDSYAKMALGYRYWSGINVAANCEIAQSYYRKVAAFVANKISSHSSSGPVVHRIRLYDEEEKVAGAPTSNSQAMLDEDLLQYYQLLADRGDIQAQYGLGLLHYQGARGINIQVNLN
jgi:SEL1 protein